MPTAVVKMTLQSFAEWARARAAAVRSPQSYTPLYKQLAVLSDSKIREGFNQSVDPDGNPWPPVRYRQGKTLLDKGLLRGSCHTVVTSRGISQIAQHPGATAHQFGITIHIPEVVPTKRKALRFVLSGRVVFARRARAHVVVIPVRRYLGYGERFFLPANGLISAFMAKLAAGE
jgi:phage gpG-like protein